MTRQAGGQAGRQAGAPGVEGPFVLVSPSSSVEHQIAHDLIPSTKAVVKVHCVITRNRKQSQTTCPKRSKKIKQRQIACELTRRPVWCEGDAVSKNERSCESKLLT